MVKAASITLLYIGAILCIFLVGYMIFMAGYALYLNPSIEKANNLLNKWQTILSGGFALMAAAIAAYVVVGQTKSNERLAEIQRERRSDALWAALTFALSDICGYARDCMTTHEKVFEERFGVVGSPPKPRGTITVAGYPSLPESFSSHITEVISHSDNKEIKQLRKLIVKTQVQKSRIENMWPTLSGAVDPPRLLILPDQIIDAIVDAAEIYALAEKNFQFARGDTKSFPSDVIADDVVRAISLASLGFEIEEKAQKAAAARSYG